MSRPDLAPQVIFGLFDGAMSILGAVYYTAGHADIVLPLALSGGLWATCSMAAGEWLSISGDGGCDHYAPGDLERLGPAGAAEFRQRLGLGYCRIGAGDPG